MTIDELEKEIQALSNDECLSLFKRLGLGEASKTLHANIRIHDLHGGDRIKPRAVIEYKDGSEESIDIIESVRNNAASIGHPAILLAIHRWEQIVRYHRSFRGNEEYFNLFRRKPLKLKEGEKILNIAEGYLERIGVALLEGAKKRALTKEAVFVMAVGGLGYDTDYSYLRLATELLATDELRNLNSSQRKLEVLRRKLEDLGSVDIPYEDIGEDELKEHRDKFLINPIIDFLKSDRGGRRFLSEKINLTSRSDFTKWVRPEASVDWELPEKDKKWREIVNQFDAWRFNMSVVAVKTYRSRAESQAKNQEPNIKATADDDWMPFDDNATDSTEYQNALEDFFFSNYGYCEESAVFPSCGPRQPFNEVLDTSSLVPDDPGYFSFIDISQNLSVPYPLSTYPGFLRTINSWFQAIRTWLVLPTKNE